MPKYVMHILLDIPFQQF